MAADADVRLILVLTNNWSDYGGAPAVVEMAAPGEGLPKDAFWSEPRAVALQRAYVTTLVERVNGVVLVDDAGGRFDHSDLRRFEAECVPGGFHAAVDRELANRSGADLPRALCHWPVTAGGLGLIDIVIQTGLHPVRAGDERRRAVDPPSDRAPPGQGRGSQDTSPTALERRVLGIVLDALGRPPVTFVLWNGEEVAGSDEAPRARVHLRDRALLRQILR